MSDQASIKNLDIVDLLRQTVESGASDLIVTVGLPPMVRVDGKWTPTSYELCTPNDTRRLMYAMMDEKKQRNFEESKDLDFSFSLVGTGRFRVNAYFQKGAVGGVLRTISSDVLSFDILGLPKEVQDIARIPRGLVLVTGPTGSGKSTTLASMIDLINREYHKHIVTIEDPIEFYHEHKQCVLMQREVGEDTRSFSAALRGVLRQAPDVILVGEMRDHETIHMAVSAAETGHLVMGTLHTNSASEAVDRIIDVFPEAQQQQVRVQLANNFQAILVQQLIKKEGGGRALAYEFMLATPAVRNLIRESKAHQINSAIQMGGSLGMQTMDTHLAKLHLERKISYETGLDKAVDAKEFARLVEEGQKGKSSTGSPSKPGGGTARPAGRSSVSGSGRR
jgi:twitching motility protein PilT